MRTVGEIYMKMHETKREVETIARCMVLNGCVYESEFIDPLTGNSVPGETFKSKIDYLSGFAAGLDYSLKSKYPKNKEL